MQSATIDEMSNDERQKHGGLSISPVFHQFVERDLLPVIGIKSGDFWPGLEALVNDLTPINRALLEKRDELQARIDAWHAAHPGRDWDHDEYVAFLREIGYLVPEGDAFEIETDNVDAEIYGLDLGWRYSLTGRVGVEGNASYTRGRRTDVADNLSSKAITMPFMLGVALVL